MLERMGVEQFKLICLFVMVITLMGMFGLSVSGVRESTIPVKAKAVVQATQQLNIPGVLTITEK